MNTETKRTALWKGVWFVLVGRMVKALVMLNPGSETHLNQF